MRIGDLAIEHLTTVPASEIQMRKFNRRSQFQDKCFVGGIARRNKRKGEGKSRESRSKSAAASRLCGKKPAT